MGEESVARSKGEPQHSSKLYSFKIAPISRSSVMTRPSKPNSSRSNCGDDAMTERRRCFLLFETGIPPVTNHHAISIMVLRSSRTATPAKARRQRALRDPLFAGPIDFWQTVMGIDHRSGVAGEMFPAAGHARRSQRVVKRRRVPNNLLDRFSVTATTQRIVRVVIKRNIEHGTEIEIETEQSQQVSGNVAVFANQLDVSLVAQLLSAWGSFPIKRSRDTRPPSWSMVIIGSMMLKLRRSSMSFRNCPGVLIFRPNKMNPPGCTRRSSFASSGPSSRPLDSDKQ